MLKNQEYGYGYDRAHILVSDPTLQLLDIIAPKGEKSKFTEIDVDKTGEMCSVFDRVSSALSPKCDQNNLSEANLLWSTVWRQRS